MFRPQFRRLGYAVSTLKYMETALLLYYYYYYYYCCSWGHVSRCPLPPESASGCSYYDCGVKAKTSVDQIDLTFALLSVQGSFSTPIMTVNNLAYSETSSTTHLTTFNTIPFHIFFLFLYYCVYCIYLTVHTFFYLFLCHAQWTSPYGPQSPA